jgi:anti-sigma regulatory factor (Ser/Thr protein kinase)
MIKVYPAEAEESRALRARLPSAPVSAANGRQHVRDAIAGWRVPISPETARDAVLVASELLTNAIRMQPGGTITLSISFYAGRLRIAVHDASPVTVTVQNPQPGELAEDGRGLVLVAALASSWGCHPIPGGKAVYAVFETGGDPLK